MTDQEKALRGRPKTVKENEVETKGTSPGWRPSSTLATLKARSGYRARWVSSDPGVIAKKKSEGWIVMKPSDNIGQYEQTESSIAGEIRYRDMIGMMMPLDMVKSREEYFRKETREATQSILSKSDGDLKRSGVSTYTPKGMPGRIVIE